eukprot:TRINITY_DN3668_c1_g1_i1.p1 TRINITY_DN3668_c1_g1~~TRINITY_DN3668_c1_g1_i1.p1  ORF type:complete len:635 (+),score=168.31 TRINITY_DN3668_c1_g1_i1:90-1994(+)
MTTQGTKVTLTIPEGAPPGTLLSIPIRGGADQIKVRVPDGCGAGSSLILTQPNGSEEWSLTVGKVVPHEDEGDDQIAAPEEVPEEKSPKAAKEEDLAAQLEEQKELEKQWKLQQEEEEKERRREEEELKQKQEQEQEQEQELGKQETGSTAVPQKEEQQEQAAHTETALSQSTDIFQQNDFHSAETLTGPERVPDAFVAFTVRLDTTVGPIDIIVRPDWAPHGTRRFLELASAGDLDDLAFYRSIKGCIVQFGLPAKRLWPPIPDDPRAGIPFLLGAVSFAAVGENTRRSTLFICIGDMSHCLGDKSWETPIGAVAESSLEALERIETVYGDISEFGGRGPDTGRINTEGNAYLRSAFPRLSYIRSAWPLDWNGTQGHPSLHATNGAGHETAADVLKAGRRSFAAAASHTGESRIAAAQAAAKEAQLQALEAARSAQAAGETESPEEALRAAAIARQAADAANAAADAAEAAGAALSGAKGSPVKTGVRRQRSAVCTSAAQVPVTVQPVVRQVSAAGFFAAVSPRVGLAAPQPPLQVQVPQLCHACSGSYAPPPARSRHTGFPVMAHGAAFVTPLTPRAPQSPWTVQVPQQLQQMSQPLPAHQVRRPSNAVPPPVALPQTAPSAFAAQAVFQRW